MIFDDGINQIQTWHFGFGRCSILRKGKNRESEQAASTLQTYALDPFCNDVNDRFRNLGISGQFRQIDDVRSGVDGQVLESFVVTAGFVILIHF